MQQTKTLNFYI